MKFLHSLVKRYAAKNHISSIIKYDGSPTSLQQLSNAFGCEIQALDNASSLTSLVLAKDVKETLSTFVSSIFSDL